LLSKNIKIKIYRTIILPVVLCKCETWSLASREARRLRVFENRSLRRIFGPKREEVTGECRRPHEELYDLYSTPNIIRVIKSRKRWAGNVALREVHTVGKPEGRRPPGRHKRRWENSTKIDFQEVIRVGGMNWIGLAERGMWRTAVNAVMNLLVPYNVENFFTNCGPVSFSRRTLLHEVSYVEVKQRCY
jgi:hypothetical protein